MGETALDERYFAASITAALLVVMSCHIMKKGKSRETNAIIVLPEPTDKNLCISIVFEI